MVEVKEREEREGMEEVAVMSMKREAPSVALQSVKVDPVMVSVGVSDRVMHTPPPFTALHRVKLVDPVMERVHEEDILPDIAAPFPSLYVRSVKVHDAILADPPELIETAELDIVTGDSGVADATEMLVRDTLPLSTITIGQPSLSMKSIFSMVTPVRDVVVAILNKAVAPLSMRAATDFVGFVVREVFLAMLNPSEVIAVVSVSGVV